MASVSSGSRDCHQGEASMEVEAQEMSRLAARATDMSRRVEVAAERSRRAAEVARRSRSADASDCSWEHGEFSLNGHYLVVLTFVCRNANETLEMIFGAAWLPTSIDHSFCQ